jgi:hypothetical protein
MRADVKGRVGNITLPATKPLLPLYEAVVNSIQAIEDAETRDGRITVDVIRDPLNLLHGQAPELSEVTGFSVTDNGIGFNARNYLAFDTADTTYKAERGGKGIGRFFWLVAFGRVEVVSRFREGGEWSRREFCFSVDGDGVHDMRLTEASEESHLTTVRLLDYQERYRRQCPRKLETIAKHLVEHCLEFFIRDGCPVITLVDQATGQSINLNDAFSVDMAAVSSRRTVSVEGHDLSVLHIRLSYQHAMDHLLHFCADNRVVKSEKLLGRLPNLSRRLQGEDGKDFVYAGYVDGQILDESANSERTGFAISEDDSELQLKDLTWQTVQQAVLEECRDFLAPYTEPIRLKKRARIETFVANEEPMYRPILKYIEDKIELIDPEISDAALDMRLYEAYHEVQVDLKAQGEALLQKDPRDEDWEDFQRQLDEYFSKVGDINKSDLARYVCHRRAVLDFLQRQLSITEGGKYRREDRVHQVVFPMRKTSNDVPFMDHNLWLLDERLVYHAFLASDKPLSTVPEAEIESGKEPDIVVFDKVCAFGTGDPPYSAITIIEFKRPMRTDYSEADNPFVQVRGYITDIRAGRARTATGRDVPLAGTEVPFYCHIVCDLSPRLTELAYDFELQKTSDGQGFFGYKKQYNAYFEVVSYTKLLTDAKQRNVAFFDKLGLPTRLGQ